MSLKDNNTPLIQLERALKASEALQKKIQLPRSLEIILNSQKELEQIHKPSLAMREIFKQQEHLTKAFQISKTLQKGIDRQQQVKSLFPENFNTSSSLIFPKSIWHSLLATTDNFSSLQSLSETIAKQHSIFSNPSISALLNVQRYMKLLPTHMQTQLVDDAIEASQVFDTSEKVLTEVTDFFKNTDKYDIKIPVEERKFPQTSSIAIVIIFYILNLLNDQFQMALFEYQTKPILAAYLTSKEVKSLVREEVKRNDLTSLYGKRITLTNLNLRDKPKQSATLLETIETGKILYIVKEKGLHKSWLKVEVEYNGEKTQGYVLRRYTTIIKP